MYSMDDEIYAANEKHVKENARFSEAQAQQLSKIIDEKLAPLSQETYKQRSDMEFLLAANDPTKPNFQEVAEVAARLIHDDPALKAGFSHAPNKADFLYRVGLREQAYQQQLQQQQASQQQAPQTQAPQQAMHQQMVPQHAMPQHTVSQPTQGPQMPQQFQQNYQQHNTQPLPQYSQPQPQPRTQVLPTPQFSTSPYRGEMSVNNVQWGQMSEEQFLGALQSMNLQL